LLLTKNKRPVAGTPDWNCSSNPSAITCSRRTDIRIFHQTLCYRNLIEKQEFYLVK
jgi:hypothetical protein